MRRFFVVVTPVCPYRLGRKIGKDCTQCDDFRGGIVENFIDCAHDPSEIEPKTERKERKTTKVEQQSKKKGRPAKKAISKSSKTRKTKKR